MAAKKKSTVTKARSAGIKAGKATKAAKPKAMKKAMRKAPKKKGVAQLRIDRKIKTLRAHVAENESDMQSKFLLSRLEKERNS